MTFEHYIITRFNLPIFTPKVNGGVVNSCNDDYLAYRFALFESYCFPSIKNQSCQNFKWLVLFDVNTPDAYKKRAEVLHNKYRNFIPCFLDLNSYRDYPSDYQVLCKQYDELVNKFFPSRSLDLDIERERVLRTVTPRFILDEIRKVSSSIPDYYITTRLDNDDALHKGMIAAIQEKFEQFSKEIVFDFVNTYKFILSDRIAYSYPLENGHFISYVEPTTRTFRSVLFWNHLYVDKFVQVEHFYQRPLQIELIHGDNVVNDFSNLTISGLLQGFFYFRTSDFAYPLKISCRRFCRILLFLLKGKLRGLTK